MQILNLTSWRSDDLRALAAAVAERELDAFQRRGFVVEFRPGRRIHGVAWIGSVRSKWIAASNAARPGWHVRMFLPSPRTSPLDLVTVALVLAHEFAHARGLRHSEMKGGPYDCSLDANLARYAYAAALVVRSAEKKKADPNAAAEKARVRVAEIDRAIARLSRLRAKWARRLGARERVLRAAAGGPAAPKEGSPE